jgi:thiosulfate/3-mercaptopyruvate sulfurtransferase
MSTRASLSVLILSASVLAAPAAAQPSAGRAVPLVVTPEWVAAQQARGPLVLLQIGDKAEYEKTHIPGAQYVALADVSDPDAALRLQMASPERLAEAFAARGISDDSRIVLYWGSDWVTPTARVFVALDFLGLGDRTAIMNGGLPAWRAEHRPITAEVTAAAAGRLTPRPRPGVIVDAPWIERRLKDPALAILDARDTRYYTGEDDGRGRIPRPGHIAGAKSIPYASLVTASGVLKDTSALGALFTAAGVPAGGEVVTYCHIGQQASLLYVAARLLGYRVHLYDGSYEEWSADPALPIEKSVPKH